LAVKLKPHETVVMFDFLDPGDGGVIAILHQGSSPPRLLGTIMGSKMDRPMKGALFGCD